MAWGGLSVRTISLVRKLLHVESLEELKIVSPSAEDLLSRKGVGWKTAKELAKVLPLRLEELPSRVITPTPLPPETWRVTRFFNALIEAGAALPPGEERSADVACMAGPRRAWCLGVVRVRRIAVPPAVAWRCPRCGRSGEIGGVEGHEGGGLKH